MEVSFPVSEQETELDLERGPELGKIEVYDPHVHAEIQVVSCIETHQDEFETLPTVKLPHCVRLRTGSIK
jgi:hypothetical protein